MNEKIIETLTEKAYDSEHKEAYLRLENKKTYLLGLRATITNHNQPEYFLDATFYLCTDQHKLNIPYLKEITILVETLEKHGYIISCQEGLCLFAEKQITKDNNRREYQKLKQHLRCLPTTEVTC